MAHVVVLGANGQLGRDLCRTLAASHTDFHPLTHQDVDVCDYPKVAETLAALRPDTVVNTTAFHRVDLCESEVEQTFAVNCFAVRNLAAVCRDIGARLVHFSTDYVFDGQARRPYAEDAAVNPLNAYGASKAAGEFFVRNIAPRFLLVRSSGLYGVGGATAKAGNFVETMLRIGRERGVVSVVTDQVLTPTSTADLAGSIAELIATDATGLFHVTNGGSCSWFEFARAIFSLSDQRIEVRPTTSEVMITAAKRPAYSVLDNRRLRQGGFSPLRPWRQALAAYMAARKAAPTVAV
jgi:dTDP-4-dehydrorhamnose reductase